MIVTLYTYRVVLKALGIEDYGIYNIVGGIVTMFAAVNLSLSAASQRFITVAIGKNDYEYEKKVFKTAVSLHLILAFFLTIIVEIVGLWLLKSKINIPDGKQTIATIVFHWSVLTLFVNVASVPYNSLIIAHEKMNAFAYLGIIDGILRFVVAFAILYLNQNQLIWYGGLLFACALIQRLLYSVYCVLKFEEAKGYSCVIDKHVFKEMFSFTGWNMLGNYSLVLIGQGTNILLNMFYGVTINAARGVCTQIEHGIMQFVGNFQTALNPQITKSISSSDHSRGINLVEKGSRLSFFLLSVFAVPIIFNCETILSFWLVELPPYVVAFVQLSMIYSLSDTMSKLLTHSLLATGKICFFQISVSITRALSLPLSYMMLRHGQSPLCVLIVNIIVEFICMIERLIILNNYISFPIKKFLINVTIKCWSVFFMVCTINWLMIRVYASSGWVNFILSIVITVVFGFYVGLKESERKYIVLEITNRLKR